MPDIDLATPDLATPELEPTGARPVPASRPGTSHTPTIDQDDPGTAGTGRTDATGSPSSVPLLRIEGLGVSFLERGGIGRTRVLDCIELTVRPGEIVGIVGETGSGKTTLARAVAGLTPADRGQVRLDGQDILGLRTRARRRFRRGGAIQFVFQYPLRSLDPELTIGASIAEGMAIAGVGSRSERAERVAGALTLVGLDPAVAQRRPAQISGGQRQRASIARAVVADPRLLLCDEPVSALDASNRNHILILLDELRRRLSVGIVVISHDLSSLAGIADRVVVLYRGRVVEDGPIADVFAAPRHPYTALLIASAPDIHGRNRQAAAALRPAPAPGIPDPTTTTAATATTASTAAAGPAPGPRPDARDVGGCVFAHRCPFATVDCDTAPPRVEAPGRPAGSWISACHHDRTWRARLPTAAAGTAAATAAAGTAAADTSAVRKETSL
ncbi:ABC transporter ATP-binding protein [Candidatus Frankia nodulisporulans]|uniref:ABC transporter ATP-binding protein n=1 Tax=Candidatus Frankia nodulisporulans TaxID=2060052 RepID=UPI0015835088|nr:ATP-binding cassette domain-containing protein [Candidatus Frankia nodulisporulans]